MSKLVIIPALLASALVALPGPAAGDGPDAKDVQAIVEKAAAYLKAHQGADGSFSPRIAGPGITAVVDYVSTEAEFTPPVIFSNETSGKLVYMIEARAKPEDGRSLAPGQPVRVRLQ